MIVIKKIETGPCDQCKKLRGGIRFELEKKSGQTAFLCWKHFRKAVKALLESREVTWSRSSSKGQGWVFSDSEDTGTSSQGETTSTGESISDGGGKSYSRSENKSESRGESE